MQRKRAPEINMEAIKTLVVAYGPRAAARKAGLKEDTVCQWAVRYQWKQARTISRVGEAICKQSPAEALQSTLNASKTASTLHLATYTERASKRAAEAKDPLSIARKVRDVAAVHQVLWPTEKRTEIIQASILLSPDSVTESRAGDSLDVLDV